MIKMSGQPSSIEIIDEREEIVGVRILDAQAAFVAGDFFLGAVGVCCA